MPPAVSSPASAPPTSNTLPSRCCAVCAPTMRRHARAPRQPSRVVLSEGRETDVRVDASSSRLGLRRVASENVVVGPSRQLRIGRWTEGSTSCGPPDRVAQRMRQVNVQLDSRCVRSRECGSVGTRVSSETATTTGTFPVVTEHPTDASEDGCRQENATIRLPPHDKQTPRVTPRCRCPSPRCFCQRVTWLL